MVKTKTQLKKENEENKQRNLRANIEMHQMKSGISNEKMAASLGINSRVYRKKVLNPQLFKYIELVTVFYILKFTESEILESI